MEKKMIMQSLILGGTLLLSVSCGKDHDKKSVQGTPAIQPARVPEKGVYQARLRPLNDKVAPNIQGTATLTLKKDEFYVEMDMRNTPAEIAHGQFVQAWENCPTDDHDVNKDGYIDAVEAGKIYGPYLIPLDGDLKTQAMEAPVFPMADRNGKYNYRDWANMDELLNDLRSHEIIPGMVKLGEIEALNLGKRSVVVYGVPANTELPDSVATIPGANKQATLPIACGSIIKISDDVIKY